MSPRVMSREQEKLLDILTELAGGDANLVHDALSRAGKWRPWGRAVPSVQDLLFYIVDNRERRYESSSEAAHREDAGAQ